MSQDINVNINVKGASDGGKKVDKLGSSLKKTKDDAESLGTSLGNAWGEVNILGTSLGSVSKAFKATAASGKLMFKSIKVGLISTGIGAFVVAIGSLATYFSQTKRGAELLEKTMATLGAGIKVITDRIAKFGGSIIKIFKGDFKGAAQDMKETFKGVGEEIKTEIKLANDLAEATIKIRDSQRELNVETAQRRAEVEALKLIAEDMSLEEEVRLQAAREAFAIEQDLLDKRVANAEEELRIHQEQMAMGENTAEDLDREAQLLINVANLRQESGTKQIELNNKINGIVREIAATEKAAHDKRVSQAKIETKIIEDRIKQNTDLLKELETVGMSEEELVRHNADKKRKAQEEAAQQLLDDTRAQQQELVDAGTQSAHDMRQVMKEANNVYAQQMQDILLEWQLSVDMVKPTVDKTREDILNNLADLRITIADEQNWTTEELKYFYNKRKEERDKELEERAIFQEQVLASAQSFISSMAQMQQAGIQKEMTALEKQFNDGIISEEEYENKKLKLEEEALKKSKKAAIAQILIDTGVGISQAIQAGAGLQFPANLGAIATGVAAVLAGIASAKATLSQAVVAGGGSINVSDSGSGTGGGGGAEEPVESLIPSQLVESLAGGGDSQTIQAYVIENDISNAQALQEELEIQSTL